MVLCRSIYSAAYKLGTVSLIDKSGNPAICMEYCAVISISASDSAFDAKSRELCVEISLNFYSLDV